MAKSEKEIWTTVLKKINISKKTCQKVDSMYTKHVYQFLSLSEDMLGNRVVPIPILFPCESQVWDV